MEKNTTLQIRLPSGLLEQAKERAAAEDLSLAQVIRRYLREYVCATAS